MQAACFNKCRFILSTVPLSSGAGLSNLMHRTPRCEETLIKVECLKLCIQFSVPILIPGLGDMEHKQK